MPIGAMEVLYLLAAAAVAVLIRLYDTPQTSITKENAVAIGKTVAGAIAAAVLGAWILGINATVPEGFIVVVGLALGGLSVVKALLNVKEEVAPSG